MTCSFTLFTGNSFWEAIAMQFLNFIWHGCMEFWGSFCKELGAKMFSVAFRKWKKKKNEHDFVHRTEQ